MLSLSGEHPPLGEVLACVTLVIQLYERRNSHLTTVDHKESTRHSTLHYHSPPPCEWSTRLTPICYSNKESTQHPASTKNTIIIQHLTEVFRTESEIVRKVNNESKTASDWWLEIWFQITSHLLTDSISHLKSCSGVKSHHLRAFEIYFSIGFVLFSQPEKCVGLES